jgi:uncharacterized LabA/DUF88 family protein
LYQGLSKDIVKNGRKIFSGWKIDHRRLRIYLKDKYNVTKAFLFIGFKFDNQELYIKLQEAGYICIFKPTLELAGGRTKGNVDAELVLHSMIEYVNYDKAVIVTGDGDFFCLVQYLKDNQKLKKLIVPNQYNYSCLFNSLSDQNNNIFDFLNTKKEKLEYKKKLPSGPTP